MTDSRLLGADFARAVACLLVLAHHLSQRLSSAGEVGSMEWFRVFTFIGMFGVPMFFVLSGYLLARPFWQALDRGEAMPSLRTYALRRAARILPGFWLALWVTFVLTVTVFGATLDGQLALRVLAGTFLVADWHWVTLFPVEINGPLWSISMEVTSYVLLPLGFFAVFRLGRSGWPARSLWALVIGAALLAHIAFVASYPLYIADRGFGDGMLGLARGWMPDFNPFGFFAMFAIGSLAAGVQVRFARYQHISFDILAILSAAFATWWLLGVKVNQTSSDGLGWLDIPYGFPWFALSIGLFLATSPQTRVVGQMLDNAVVRYLARISFGIYVWHYVVLELVRLYVAPDMDSGRMTDPTRFALISLLITGLSMIVADLSFRFLENPIIQWARRFERERAS